MKQNVVSLISGIIFGFGLALSGMLDPQVVVGFLDVTGKATGAWNPRLLFVMAGALIVSVVMFRWILQKSKPVCSDRFQVPTKTEIDIKLVVGAALFGIGWGFAGICPGPAVAGLATGRIEILIFLISMLAGMGTYALCEKLSGGQK